MANPILPKGFHAGDWDDYTVTGYWVDPEDNKKEEVSKTLTIRCTCGTSITAGYEVPIEQHSYYCDLVRKDDNSETS